MKNHKDCKRAYIRSSKAYYSDVLDGKICVMVGMYHDEGGTTGEFEFEWKDIGLDYLAMRLKCFGDSFGALKEFQDLLEELAILDNSENVQYKSIQEPDFCKILDKLGIVDVTQYYY